MTKTNEKIHVLADESLGGIKREYVEVDRKAEVGDKIVIVDKRYPGDIYENGDIFTVDREAPPGSGFVGSDGAASDMNTGGLIYLGEYRVLEPTNVVHIDGPDGTERYEMVDRPPEIGGKVLRPSDGFVAEVVDFDIHYVYVPGAGVYADDLLTLVPVESSEEEPQPSDPIDVIANLATRVAELERKVSGFETTIERHEYVNDRHKDEIDTLHKDSRRHGEELEALNYAAKETDGKMAHLEADSDMRLFTAEEVAALLDEMRKRQ
ncbi:hypothetical protein [Bacillus paralicheniformis]|uniref:hypothetical protein n=1 Tax=Bacillus paralicheniformis TaxID=1648923 RepID=UPI003DA114BF